MTERQEFGIAAHAKLAGLGIAAAVTLAVAAAPGPALALEAGPVGPAPSPVAGPSEGVAQDGADTSSTGQAAAAAPIAIDTTNAVALDAKDSASTPQAGGAKPAPAMAAPGGSDGGNAQGVASQDATPQDGPEEATPASAGDHEAPAEAGSGPDAPATAGQGSAGETPASSSVSASGQEAAGGESGPSQSGTASAGSPVAAVAGSVAGKASPASSAKVQAAPAEKAATAPAKASASKPAAAAPTTTVVATSAASAPAGRTINVFRMYNPNSGEHFYTSSEAEGLHLFNVGWRWEGVSYRANSLRGTAVYRLYNPNAGNHFYTTSKRESDHVAAAGWNYEGIAWYAVGTTRLYRLYNPNDGTHVYTTSASERDSVTRAGWRYEGTAWSVLNGYVPLDNKASHMVYSSAYGSYQRYWIASNSQIARSRIVHASENHLGYDVYATSSGALARNRHVAVSQVVYSAANDGRLSLATNLRGIDVSSYQAGMNTANVDADFVIVKATQGTGYVNPAMRAQAAGAYNSGKLLGFYHYASTDFGGGNPVAEADFFVQQVGSYAGKALLVLDWEGIENSNFGVRDAQYVKAFLDRVYQRTGVRGVVYMSRSATSSADYSAVARSGYGLWVAQYLYYNGRSEYPGYVSSPMTTHSSTTWRSGMTGAWSTPALYQYTSKGHVSGYSGELDLNVFYKDSSAWAKMARRV